MPQAELQLDLRPARDQDETLTPWKLKLSRQIAQEYSLPFDAVKTNALTLLRGPITDNDDRAGQLRQMAAQALDIASGAPCIAQALGLTGASGEMLSADRYHVRLYEEYQSLGFSKAEALGALSSNQWSLQRLLQEWKTPEAYRGRVLPIETVEALSLEEFVEKISPYIERNMTAYLHERARAYDGVSREYARSLAFDIYSAAEAFALPKTFLLSIAHQETYFANVLGDSRRSASPFQIFAPTKKVIIHTLARQGFVAPPSTIRLERHLTMSTYMAAFHLKQLIYENSTRGFVDTDLLMRRYNGAGTYVLLVAQRYNQLANFADAL
jgi:hypothetical protein